MQIPFYLYVKSKKMTVEITRGWVVGVEGTVTGVQEFY
jgi:hypothetical protein